MEKLISKFNNSFELNVTLTKEEFIRNLYKQLLLKTPLYLDPSIIEMGNVEVVKKEYLFVNVDFALEVSADVSYNSISYIPKTVYTSESSSSIINRNSSLFDFGSSDFYNINIEQDSTALINIIKPSENDMKAFDKAYKSLVDKISVYKTIFGDDVEQVKNQHISYSDNSIVVDYFIAPFYVVEFSIEGNKYKAIGRAFGKDFMIATPDFSDKTYSSTVNLTAFIKRQSEERWSHIFKLYGFATGGFGKTLAVLGGIAVIVGFILLGKHLLGGIIAVATGFIPIISLIISFLYDKRADKILNACLNSLTSELKNYFQKMLSSIDTCLKNGGEPLGWNSYSAEEKKRFRIDVFNYFVNIEKDKKNNIDRIYPYKMDEKPLIDVDLNGLVEDVFK